ncbi:SpoIIIAH-like family protein [Paenibacillus tuaregi]|uniref:SpoIIIAH-like family protein n=1 Tax=Paenibacillus tuaregi TaxID=1816681 RepID=UPI000838C17B|nr:SpoIIIAH-like family protein [Paenibacillus tuaregi]
MKTNRQTIWLVSMLSLMVILSAYYLFTEDSGTKTPKVAEGQQVTAKDKSGTKDTPVTQAKDDVVVTEVTGNTDAAAPAGDTGSAKQEPASTPSPSDKIKEGADTGKSAGEDTKPKSGGTDATGKTNAADDSAKKDEEVIKKIEAQGTSGNDAITNYQYERVTENAKLSDKLTKIIADQSKPADESAKAQKELAALQDKESKITDIETKLQQQYANAVVTEKDSQYTVVVLSDKLEPKQAVGIVDMVIKELGVSQDKVKVQYIKQ